MKQLLIALLAALFIFPLVSYGQEPGSTLNPKQLAKLERFLNQLDQLEVFMNSGDAARYQTRLAKLSDGFTGTAGSLTEGDVKTDTATALYWYEQLALSMNHSDPRASGAAAAERCGNERPGAYQKLCETTSGSLRDLSWAKARLHLGWARAGIVFQKTGKLQRPLDDIALERQIDRMLAARIIESLKSLASEVIIYRSLADFEASGRLAQVPFAVFKQNLRKASADIEADFSWLPQNLLKTEILNALHSFQDGAFWWEQIYEPRVIKVSDLPFRDRDRTASASALITTVPYTIAVNWRHGSRYLLHAEQLMKPQAVDLFRRPPRIK